MRWLSLSTIVLVLAGCTHGGSHELPAVCTNGFGDVLKALRSAPGDVRMAGTPISDCFTSNATGDQLQIVGTNLLAAAQQLGDKARAGERRAALELGYLIGAADQGSRRNNDLGAEIVRRLEAEASGLRAGRASFERGLHAGSANG